MRSRVLRSWLLALFALSWAFLIDGVVLFGLNERFMDSLLDGWVLFFALPVLLSFPLAVLFLIVSPVPPRNAEANGGRSLGLFLAVAVVPVAILLLNAELQRLLVGSEAVRFAAVLVALLVLIAGTFRVGQWIARRFCPGGTPRKAFLFVPLLLLLLLPPVGVRLSWRPISFDDGARTLFLCVDGATWKLIDPMTARGELPTFQALQREGTRFEMESIQPLMSPILWTTIASGVGPDVHGVTSFYTSAAQVKAPRLWDIVEQKGGRVGLLAWPVTWPPRPVSGFMIPSLFARGPETYPEELQFIRELAMLEKGRRKRELGKYALFAIRSVQYGVKLSTMKEAVKAFTGKRGFLEDLSVKRELKLHMHGDMFLELWERYQPDFAAFYNNAVDVTSHYFWKYFEPERFPDVTPEEAIRYGDKIPQMYRSMDEVLGRILRFAPDDLRIVLVSDHGLKGMETASGGTVRLIRTENFLRLLELEKWVVGMNLASEVHLKAKEGARSIPPDVARRIEGVTIEGTGERLFRMLGNDPEALIITVAPGVSLEGRRARLPDGTIVPVSDLVDETLAKISGEHMPEAILLFRGEAVRRGERGGGATINDVAPTSLYLMGLPVGERMEGRILESAFVDGYVQSHPPVWEDYRLTATIDDEGEPSDDETLKEQLRALGYLN